MAAKSLISAYKLKVIDALKENIPGVNADMWPQLQRMGEDGPGLYPPSSKCLINAMFIASC